MSVNHSGRLAYGAVPFWLALSFPGMFLAFIAGPFLPRLVGNYLFFAPQYLFAFSQAYEISGSVHGHFFAPGTAGFFCAALWLVVTIGYGRIARSWPIGRTIWLALAVVLAVVCAVNLGFFAFGYRIGLDGP